MIPNEYQDAKCNIRIPGEARQALDVIERFTFGFNKRDAKISLRTFRQRTRLNDCNIIRSRNILLKMGIITTFKKGNRNEVYYRIQRDYTKWKPLSKMKAIKIDNKNTIKVDNKPLSKLITPTPNSKYTSLNTISLNTEQQKVENSQKELKYKKIRTKKIETLKKKYAKQFEKAKKTGNLEWLENINNLIQDELAKFSQKFWKVEKEK